MAVIARYLVDTSAAARMHHERFAQRVAPSITAGLVATYAPLDLEALFSVRGPRDDELIRADRPAAHEYLPVLDGHWHRAMDVQRSLAAVSRHRGVGLNDLVVAPPPKSTESPSCTTTRSANSPGVQALWVVERGDIA